MEQIKAVKDDLQAFEKDIVGRDGLSREKVFIISLISAFLGDNPPQATISMLRGTTLRANCRKCLR
jgi:hypothetical protein